jgi:nicotinamidase/pyrazinamidase
MKSVFFDVDTQIDFVWPAGALYVPGAERIIDTVGRMNRRAAAAGTPLVSTVDAHAESDPEFRDWPPHCVVGTVGQQKPPATLINERMVIPATEWAERIDGVPQLILEKPALSSFSNPNLEGLLLAFNADRYVVYGVVAEICVKMAAEALLTRGHKVEIVTDAIRGLKPAAAEAALREMAARGATLTTTAAFLS